MRRCKSRWRQTDNRCKADAKPMTLNKRPKSPKRVISLLSNCYDLHSLEFKGACISIRYKEAHGFIASQQIAHLTSGNYCSLLPRFEPVMSSKSDELAAPVTTSTFDDTLGPVEPTTEKKAEETKKPYSIYNSREKWLIVILASFAGLFR